MSYNRNSSFNRRNSSFNRRNYSSNRRNQQREMHDTTCAECQKETQVPFKPDGERPVYCQDCYRARRPQRY